MNLCIKGLVEDLTHMKSCFIRAHYQLGKAKVKSLSRVQLFVTPWTVAYQAPPSMEFSRQEYWSGLPSPSPGDLPDLNPGLLRFRQMLYHLSHQGSSLLGI